MKALLIIDVQNDYFPNGKCQLVGAEQALVQIKLILEFFRQNNFPVIHIQHINTRADAIFFLPDTAGAQIHPELAPQPQEHLIIKNTPNSFYQTELLSTLKQLSISSLTVCGMMTHMCIDSTVRAAKDHQIPVHLLYDACATKDLTIMDKRIPAAMVHNAYMAGLNNMFAQIWQTQTYINYIAF